MSSRSKMGENPSTKLPNTPEYKRRILMRRPRKPSFEERVLGKKKGVA